MHNLHSLRFVVLLLQLLGFFGFCNELPTIDAMAAAAEDPVAVSEISSDPALSSSSVETAFSRYACTQATLLCFFFFPPLFVSVSVSVSVCVLSSEICVV